MCDRINAKGQTLVELAMVFPIILLMLACMLQLVVLILLHMKLHRTAAQMAAQLAMGQPKAVLEATALAPYANTLRWGIPIPNLYTESIPEWRPYKGISTTSQTNCRAVVELTFPLSGNWFARVGLGPAALHARAVLPCEPSGMADLS